MNEYLRNFEYIKEQLIYIKTKVDIENKLNLYDINKLSENIFNDILNDVYDLNLKNANQVLQSNYPAIDLVDEENQIVFQVTSKTTKEKVEDTIKKWKKGGYSHYKLKFFYLKDKPNFQKNTINQFCQDGITQSDLLNISDILKKVEGDDQRCKKVYGRLKSNLETISFSVNIKDYFKNFEPHLVETITSKAFEKYKKQFLEFIQSDKNVLEIYSSGGNGKSHLLKYLSEIDTKYIPIIFTKQTQVLEDLKKLPDDKCFLFMFDDIDRFLDTNILIELLSYTSHYSQNIKLLFSYRTASKSLIRNYYRKYSSLQREDLEIIWSNEDIIDLIQTIKPDITKPSLDKLPYIFNNNPYLITQTLKGNIKSIKDFSLKIVDDVKKSLNDFNFSNYEINELLFKLAITTPLDEEYVQELEIYNIKKILNRLDNSKILRKLLKKYRFNPDIQGDLYLAYYINEYGTEFFVDILEKYLNLFSNTVFTNIGYTLSYLDNKDTLSDYLDKLISKWRNNNEYSNNNLRLINKIVSFIPEKSFIYLINATKVLKPKENNKNSELYMKTVIYTADKEINLGVIEPIVSQLIYMLKNENDCGYLTIKEIMNYLSSDICFNLSKSDDFKMLKSILNELFSPLRTRNYQIILDAIDIATEIWLSKPLNDAKVELFYDVIIKNLLGVTFDDNYIDGITYHYQKKLLNTNHSKIKEIIFKIKDIVLQMFDDDQLFYIALDSILANAYDYDQLSNDDKVFYDEIKKEFLTKILSILEQRQNKLSFKILAKIDNIAIDILKFDEEKEIALKILEVINRTYDYIFYQLVTSRDFIILDYNDFYEEYKTQTDIKKWLLHAQDHRKYYCKFDVKFLKIIKELSNKSNVEDILKLLNLLDISSNDYKSNLLKLLGHWFDQNNKELINLYHNKFDDVRDENIKNVLKELLLKKNAIQLSESDINDDVNVDDLKIYTTIIFNDFDKSKINLVDKLFVVIKNKDENTINFLIGVIAQQIYFTLKNNNLFSDIFKVYIIKLLKLQLKYNLKDNLYFDSYITFSLEIIKEQNELSEDIVNILIKIIKGNTYKVREDKLKTIYRLLNLGLKELLDNLYIKLISKKEDSSYRYQFNKYTVYSNLNEVVLLKEYIKSYEDFKYLTEVTYKYYNDFIEYSDETKREIRIDLSWFFPDNINVSYLEKFFNELHSKNEIEKIKVFYRIVPVSLEYSEIIIKNLNILKDINDDEIIHYFINENGIKDYSRTVMQNRSQLLNEEKFFQKLSENIESFSLKITIKGYLQYIQKEKQQEIERDIGLFLDK